MAKPLSVLIIEDSESDAQLIVRLLTRAGYLVASEQVESAQSMGTALVKQSWDIIISDFRLPQFSGEAALQLLQESGLDIPFIIVSGQLGEETAVEMMKGGAHDYVMKANLARLVPAVDRELAQNEVRRARKRAEEDLRISEDKFKYVFDYSATGKSITLPGGDINVNHALCAMLGYSKGELKNKKWQEISHPDDISYTQSLIDSLINGEIESARFTKRYLHKNGSVVWTDVSTSLRRDQAGKPMYFMTTIIDITERLQMENALRESEERWRSLVSATPDYIALYDREGKFLFLNHYAQGFSEKDVIGTSFYQFMAQDSRDIFQQNFDKAIKTWSIQHFEHSALGDNHIIRTYDNYLVPIRDKNQEVMIMAVSRDITDRKNMEFDLRDYNKRLEADVIERTSALRDAQEQLIRQEKLAVLGQLAGGVGHELRNPLAVISNAVYYLNLVQPDSSPKIHQYHAMIAQEVRNAEKIITDLLDFARIKSVDREHITVSELFERVRARYPEPDGITTNLEIPDDLSELFVDPRQLEQVLGNIVLNAYQAMPQGGVLTVTAQQHEDKVAIAVHDSGLGIPPENIQKIFEPLFTTKPKGIGLGLAVSKKLVEANEGTIDVQSVVGKGSTFTVYLPTK